MILLGSSMQIHIACTNREFVVLIRRFDVCWLLHASRFYTQYPLPPPTHNRDVGTRLHTVDNARNSFTTSVSCHYNIATAARALHLCYATNEKCLKGPLVDVGTPRGRLELVALVKEALKGIVEQAAGRITSGGIKNCAIKRAGLGHFGKLEVICTEG